jgi:hypothetical protein
MISALYVRKDSIYKELGIDSWDIERDARLYDGNGPIICHPPCRAWGKYKGFAKPREGEKLLAIESINKIRKLGGVLEHPRHSSLWKEMDLPVGNEIDEFGGFSIYIDQFVFGHKARKATLLYVCGIDRSKIPSVPLKFDAITHYVGFPKSFNGRNGMKEITKKEREQTPIELAKWLIRLCEQIELNRS